MAIIAGDSNSSARRAPHCIVTAADKRRRAALTVLICMGSAACKATSNGCAVAAQRRGQQQVRWRSNGRQCCYFSSDQRLIYCNVFHNNWPCFVFLLLELCILELAARTASVFETNCIVRFISDTRRIARCHSKGLALASLALFFFFDAILANKKVNVFCFSLAI